ncbi:MAG TPA: Calx-beta domain-containing protein [Acidimicrobiia bacterium]|nr:Calx-beta domain-containing protein [Acidimicrobiia bacterium]
MTATRTGLAPNPRRSKFFAWLLMSSLCTVGLVVVPATVASASTIGVTYAWGANVYGELGNGTTTDSSSPVGVVGAAPVTFIAAGARHSIAIYGDGTVRAWGKNTSGELGNGTTTNSSLAKAVTGFGAGSGVIAVAGGAPPISTSSVSGNGHSMALKSDGTVYGWGNDNSGEVGNGTIATAPVLTPVAVSGLGAGSGVVVIAAGASHSLALKSDGTVLAWGHNVSGQLGDGTAPTDHSTPVQVSGLGSGSGVVAIAGGTAFSLALKSDGTVLAWGNNVSGQLGDGNNTDQPTPVQVSGLGAGSGVIAIAAGDAFALALKSDGTVLAWGQNASGQLGNNNAPNDSSVPVQVTGLGSGSGVTKITVGHSHAIALKSDGSVLAWGRNNSGQLGDGTTTQHNTPETLSTISNVSAIAAGGAHTLAIRQQAANFTVSVGDQMAVESNGGTTKMLFPVTLSQPATTTVSVHYAVTSVGSATGAATAGPGVDFLTKSGTISFVPGTNGLTPVYKAISVTMYGDTASEPDEVFAVTISSPLGGGYSLGRSAATGRIINDDPSSGVNIGIGNGSVMEGDTGNGRAIVFPIELSQAATTSFSFHWAVVPSGTNPASAVSDYNGTTSGTVSFTVGTTGKTATRKNLTIKTVGDLVPEPDETFQVQLTGSLPAGIAYQRATGTGTILNDDGP